MVFKALDLRYKDYDVSEPFPQNDPRTSGGFDLTPLARSDQQEVVYFINQCYERWNWPPYAKNPGRKIEILIRHYIPDDISYRKDILDWIVRNYRHYWHRLPG